MIGKPKRQRAKWTSRAVKHNVRLSVDGKTAYCSVCGVIDILWDPSGKLFCKVGASGSKSSGKSNRGNRWQTVELPYNKGRRRFQSTLEAERAVILCHYENEGLIENLAFQHRVPLIVNDVKICEYWADFAYNLPGEKELTIEDTKGHEEDLFKLKAKLFAAIFGKAIVIVKRRDIAMRPMRG